MFYLLYSIHDEVTEIFNLPFHSINEKTAIRSFQQACKDPNTGLHQSPQDYTLYYVGTYNDADGKTSNSDVPIRVITATQAINAIQLINKLEDNNG